MTLNNLGGWEGLIIVLFKCSGSFAVPAIAAIVLASCSVHSVAAPALICNQVNVQASIAPTSVSIEVINEGRGVLPNVAVPLDSSPSGLTEIAPNTRFKSLLVKISDPDSLTPQDYTATIDIDGEIIGYQTNVGNLRRTRRDLQAAGFDPGAPAGGIEGNDVIVTSNGQILVTGKVGGRGIDPIRVFIEAAAVPELASAAIWSGVMAVGLCYRRRLRDSQ